jgi:hypothetical protein
MWPSTLAIQPPFGDAKVRRSRIFGPYIVGSACTLSEKDFLMAAGITYCFAG